MLWQRRNREQRELERALERLERRGAPVRFEVERSHLRFPATPRVLRERVLVPQPHALRAGIAAGDVLRCSLPWDEQRFLRLPVRVPRYVLHSMGALVVVCDRPGGILTGTPRRYDRYDTTRYSTLRLAIPGLETPVRVLDLSLGGCRIACPGAAPDTRFEPGRSLGGARLLLGRRRAIDLADLVARCVNRHGRAFSVGLEMVLPPEGEAARILQRLIAWFAGRERRGHLPRAV